MTKETADLQYIDIGSSGSFTCSKSKLGADCRIASSSGPFFNYFDESLSIIDPLPTYPLLTLVREFLYRYKEESAYCLRFQYEYRLSTYLSHLVNVIKE